MCFLKGLFILFHDGDELQKLEVIQEGQCSYVPQSAFQADRKLCAL